MSFQEAWNACVSRGYPNQGDPRRQVIVVEGEASLSVIQLLVNNNKANRYNLRTRILLGDWEI